MNRSPESFSHSLPPRPPARDRLFYVLWTPAQKGLSAGTEARVTCDPTEARDALRWQGGHGGRVFIMSRMADCADLLLTAPKPVQQSVRQFLQALTHGQGVRAAERASRIVGPDDKPTPTAPGLCSGSEGF